MSLCKGMLRICKNMFYGWRKKGEKERREASLHMTTGCHVPWTGMGYGDIV